MRNLNVEKYNPEIEDPTSDPERFGYEAICTRKRGNGKFVIVVDSQKGCSDKIIELFSPDGVFYSIEDAESFIRTGQGVSRVDLAQH